MFVVVGRFPFRPMGAEEQQRLLQRWEEDFSPLARGCTGFQGVQFVPIGDDEIATVWQWDRAADWDAAQATFGPYLQEHLVPLLAGPPDRFAGDVGLEIKP